jgi:UDP-N-acetylmuramoylalanine-D-glutamate ligase
MLWWLSDGAAMAGLPAWAPRVSVLTNLAPNHVDWHGTFAEYVKSKAGIRSGQRPGDAFVSLFAEEQPEAAAEVARAAGGAWWERAALPTAAELEALLASIDMPEVPGEHQRRNARLAVLACEAAIRAEGAPPDRAKLVARLAGFRSLPHRMEYVGTHRGMRCFNDSKSTTPDATLLAIASFPEPTRIHLIAGGYDKKVDLSAIRELAPRLAHFAVRTRHGEGRDPRRAVHRDEFRPEVQVDAVFADIFHQRRDVVLDPEQHRAGVVEFDLDVVAAVVAPVVG